MKYRHKPTTTEAAQFDARAAKESAPPGVKWSPAGMPFVITANSEAVPLFGGEWIVLEPDGVNYYPMKPDVFEAHYELVVEQS